MRPLNASTTGRSIGSKPCSRKSAASAASSSAARTFRLRTSRVSSSVGSPTACSWRRAPSSSCRATTAQLARETTCERILASRPSLKSGKRSYSCRSWVTEPSSALLVRGDVVDGLPDGLDLLRVLVRDLDPKLVLELHDQLHEIERVGIEILLEGGVIGDLVLVDSELLRQDFLDPLEDFLSRCCHLTSLAGGFRARGC